MLIYWQDTLQFHVSSVERQRVSRKTYRCSSDATSIMQFRNFSLPHLHTRSFSITPRTLRGGDRDLWLHSVWPTSCEVEQKWLPITFSGGHHGSWSTWALVVRLEARSFVHAWLQMRLWYRVPDFSAFLHANAVGYKAIWSATASLASSSSCNNTILIQ